MLRPGDILMLLRTRGGVTELGCFPRRRRAIVSRSSKSFRRAASSGKNRSSGKGHAENFEQAKS
jgi:hypothetical protein